MIWKAYELKAYLKHLAMTDSENIGEVEWIGDYSKWEAAKKEINEKKHN